MAFSSLSLHDKLDSTTSACTLDLNNDETAKMMMNQDLSAWNVDKVIYCSYFARNANDGVPLTEWTKAKPNFTNCDPS